MSKFTFRLAALLELRVSERDSRRVELAIVLADQRDAIERCRVVAETLRQHLAETTAQAAPGRVDVLKLREAGAYESAIRQQLAAHREHAGTASADVQRCQAELTEAEAEVRVLEKLRTSQHECFQFERSRQEARVSDELAARQHCARTAGR